MPIFPYFYQKRKSIKSVDFFSSAEKKILKRKRKSSQIVSVPFKWLPDDGIIPMCIFPLIRKGKLEMLQTSILISFIMIKNDASWWRNQNVLSSCYPVVLSFCQPYAERTQPAWIIGRFAGIENRKLRKASIVRKGEGSRSEGMSRSTAEDGPALLVLAADGCCNMKLVKGQRPRSVVCSLPICAISWNNNDFQDSFTFFPLWPRHPLPPQSLSGTHPSAPLSFLPWAFPVVITKTSMSFIVLCPLLAWLKGYLWLRR